MMHTLYYFLWVRITMLLVFRIKQANSLWTNAVAQPDWPSFTIFPPFVYIYKKENMFCKLRFVSLSSGISFCSGG